jgi:hypothetical protein
MISYPNEILQLSRFTLRSNFFDEEFSSIQKNKNDMGVNMATHFLLGELDEGQVY